MFVGRVSTVVMPFYTLFLFINGLSAAISIYGANTLRRVLPSAFEGIAKRSAIEDGAAEGYFVGIFKLIAYRDASGYHCDAYIVRSQLAEDVEVCRVAFHCRAESEDNLLDASCGHTGGQ